MKGANGATRGATPLGLEAGGARDGRVLLRGAVTAAEPRLVGRPAAAARGAPPASPDAPATRYEPADASARASEDQGCAGAAAEPPAPRPVEGDAATEAALRLACEAAAEEGRERGLAQGLEDGRRQGLAEGHEAGRVAFEKEARAAREAIASRLAVVDRVVAAARSELDRRLAAAEEDMVALCHAIVCRILGDQLVTREGTAALVRQAVRDAGGRGAVAIHLHPRDAAAMEADTSLGAWMRQHAAGGTVQFVGDERVVLGGCIVRSGDGSLDARLETQLARLGDVLLDRSARGTEATRPGARAACEAAGEMPAADPHAASAEREARR